MSAARRQSERDGNVAGFRGKLLAAVGIVVSALTALGIALAERNASAGAQRDFQHGFESALASLHHVQEMRYAEISARCDTLVHNPRIHAALEDDALDLLYLNARDQLHDLVYGRDEAPAGPSTNALRSTFYRFLDARGTMIPPPRVGMVGELAPSEEEQLAVPALPARQEVGYLVRTSGEAHGTINEVLTVPIVSARRAKTSRP